MQTCRMAQTALLYSTPLRRSENVGDHGTVFAIREDINYTRCRMRSATQTGISQELSR